MGKGAAAEVIDLEAFRQRKLEEKREEQREQERSRVSRAAPFVVPVFFCWVPLWTPVFV